MKKLSISVSDFALPVPRKGSIDAFSGFGRAAQTGLEWHQKIQEERTKSDPAYRAEVAVEQAFDRAGFRFEVGGRMDGFRDGPFPQIEEIKTTFNIYELLRRLKAAPSEHPYCLQLKTYGYFHWLKTKVIPRLSLHLVSTRNGEALDFELALDIPEYEAWLEARLEELVADAKLAEKRSQRRKRAAESFTFPFAKPRDGQVELISTIEAGMSEKHRLLIQAPTGLGKTVGVLYPTLREALGRGQRVVYITPKNSQHGVAEDAIERLQEAGANIKSLTLTAKSKMCFKNEPLCNPDHCEFAKDHYTKLAENKVLEKLATKKRLTERVFKKIAKENEVCPFEIQLDAVREADAVICDYNYVFAPRSALGRVSEMRLDQEGRPNLVIDEAHNLPSRAMDYYSPSLSVYTLEKIGEDFKDLPRRFRTEARELLDACIAVVRSCAAAGASAMGEKPYRIQPPVEAFLAQDADLRGFLSTYLAADIEIQARDPILRLCFMWSEFAGTLEFISAGRAEFFTTFHPRPGTVKITCCDASAMVRESYDEYEHVVAFSATLKPFEYYAQLGGLRGERLKTAEFVSPFPKEHRKILLIPQISTKYNDRDRSAPRIAEAIAKIAAVKTGNYFAFFPSFEFAERVLAHFSAPPGFEVLRQERTMRRDAVDELIERLADRTRAHIVFAVQGGVFSEGVDYPGDMVIGAFVVGPPLPSFDLEQETRREFYQNQHGAGFEYAYAYPAMAKAVQAAGRVIRSETDRGLIVLLDGRFLQSTYTQSMPSDWFERGPRELVSERILKDVADFWGPS